MTVIASAVGPLVIRVARCCSVDMPASCGCCAASAASLLAALIVPVPSAARGDWSQLAPTGDRKFELSQETLMTAVIPVGSCSSGVLNPPQLNPTRFHLSLNVADLDQRD